MLRLLAQPVLTERVLFQFLRLRDVVAVVLSCTLARHLRFRPWNFRVQNFEAWSAGVLDLSAVDALEISSKHVLRYVPLPKSLHSLKFSFDAPFELNLRDLPNHLHTLALPIFLSVQSIDLLESQCPLLRSLACSGVWPEAEHRLAQMRLDELSLLTASIGKALPPSLRTLRLSKVRYYSPLDHALELRNLTILVIQASHRKHVELSVFAPLRCLETLCLGYYVVVVDFDRGFPPGLRRLLLPDCAVGAVRTGTQIDLTALQYLEDCDLGAIDDFGLRLPVNLTSLVFSASRLSVLADLDHMAMTHLKVNFTGTVQPRAPIHVDVRLPGLRSLTVTGSGLDSSTLEIFLTSFPLLERLDCSFRLERLTPQVQAAFRKLKALSLNVLATQVEALLGALGSDLRELELSHVMEFPPTLTERLTHLKLGSTVVKSDKRVLTSIEKFLTLT